MSNFVDRVLRGLEITCVDDEFTVFDPPSGQTCMEWAGAFMNAVGGYVDNPDDTSGCRYCQYRFGDQFFTSLNINFSNRWRDAFLILAYFAFNIAVTIGRCFRNATLAGCLSLHTQWYSGFEIPSLCSAIVRRRGLLAISLPVQTLFRNRNNLIDIMTREDIRGK
jgi:hypothetical protein